MPIVTIGPMITILHPAGIQRPEVACFEAPNDNVLNPFLFSNHKVKMICQGLLVGRGVKTNELSANYRESKNQRSRHSGFFFGRILVLSILSYTAISPGIGSMLNGMPTSPKSDDK